MKKLYILTFITILIGTIFIGTKEVNALIYNGVDYRVMETGTPIEIDSQQYNPIIISEDYGGARILDWFNYMQANNIHRVEMQAPDVSTLYFFRDENIELLETNVFRIELGYDTGIAYFYIGLFGLNNQLIGEYIDLRTSQGVWYLPSNTRVLTNINFQSNQDIYNDAYEAAKEEYGIYYNNQWLTAEEYATILEIHNFQEYYDNGYNEAKNDYGYNLDGSIVTGQTAYNTGYNEGINETDEIKMSIRDFIPGVLGSLFMFFFQIGQIGILGITLLDVLGIVLMVASLVFIIKFFF